MSYISIKTVKLTDRTSVAKSDFEDKDLAIKDCHGFMNEHIDGVNHLSASAIVLDDLCQPVIKPMQWIKVVEPEPETE